METHGTKPDLENANWALQGLRHRKFPSKNRANVAQRLRCPKVTQKWPLVRFGLFPLPSLTVSANNESMTR